MAINDIPQFFKRRFNQKEFDKYIVSSMFEWIDESTNYREFEVNVINESIVEYFWNTFEFDFFDESDIDDAYQFESFVTNKYEQKLRDFYNRSKRKLKMKTIYMFLHFLKHDLLNFFRIFFIIIHTTIFLHANRHQPIKKRKRR